MLFPVHRELGIAPNIEPQDVKVPTTLPFIFRHTPVSKERIARCKPVYLAVIPGLPA